MTPVLDASVFIAAISPAERRHHGARRLFDSHPDTEPFLVPELLRVEVVAGLSRAGEPAAFVDTVDAVIRGPRFHSRPPDAALLVPTLRVARVARLRAYQAVYFALALLAGAPILTLDGEVVERGSASIAELRVFGARGASVGEPPSIPPTFSPGPVRPAVGFMGAMDPCARRACQGAALPAGSMSRTFGK